MMYRRLARNFIKNGYFPTDEVTLARILNALTPAPAGNMAIFDPTAGEGVALAECKAHLGMERTRSYGIEIDEERAYHAKTLLDDCIHGNLMDCVMDRHSFGLLFFNPPYGDLSADHTGESVRTMGRERLEKSMYRRVCGLVQPGGVMVMIVPHYALDKGFAQTLSGHWRQVQIFFAPEQKYKQIVFFGIRGAPDEAEAQTVYQQLLDIGQGETAGGIAGNLAGGSVCRASDVCAEVLRCDYIRWMPNNWQRRLSNRRVCGRSLRRALSAVRNRRGGH